MRLRDVCKRAVPIGCILIPPFMWTTPIEAGAAVECTATYVVQAGDSWSRVSRATGIYIRPLAEANGLTRDTPLHPGMALCVPLATPSNSPADPSTPRPVALATTAPPINESDGPGRSSGRPTACDAVHNVTSLESWSSIANRYQVRLRSLLAANAAKAETVIHPGETVCVPTAPAPRGTPGTRTEAPTPARATPVQADPIKAGPDEGTCEAAIADYTRAMCLDLSERRAIIGGRRGTSMEFAAVGGYGPIEECARTIPGTFAIGHKQPITPRRRLRWGISFGGGCIGDQIVHTVSRATLESARGTGGCIGLLEADAKAAYDTLNIGDVIVIIA